MISGWAAPHKSLRLRWAPKGFFCGKTGHKYVGTSRKKKRIQLSYLVRTLMLLFAPEPVGKRYPSAHQRLQINLASFFFSVNESDSPAVIRNFQLL